MPDRRETLKIIGAIGATCAFPYASDELYGQHAHADAKEAAIQGPSHFGGSDFALVSRLADLILPATDTPGAVQAGVPLYIDLVVGRNVESQGVFRKGLDWLEGLARERYGEAFLKLSEDQQIALLTPVSEAADGGVISSDGERFFRAVKSMTADGYYTSKIGLSGELGFQGGAVLAEFPTCEVPEH